jgi:Domain of unknown function DUF11
VFDRVDQWSSGHQFAPGATTTASGAYVYSLLSNSAAAGYTGSTGFGPAPFNVTTQGTGGIRNYMKCATAAAGNYGMICSTPGSGASTIGLTFAVCPSGTYPCANAFDTYSTELATTNGTLTTYNTGSATTLAMTMTNNGSNHITGGAGWTASLPSGFASTTWACTVSGTGSCGTASGSGNTATLANVALNAGATATITFTTTPTTAGAGTATSTVTAPTSWSDTNTANNTASVNTTLSTPALANLALANVAATPSPITYLTAPGNYTTLFYEFTLTNNGPSAAPGTSFSFTAPAGTIVAFWECKLASGTGDCDTVDASHGNHRNGTPWTNSFTLSNISLANGAQARFVVRVFVNSALAAASVSVNAAVGGGVSDPDTSNNSWSTTVTAVDDATTGAIQFIDEVRQFTGSATNTVTASAWTGFAQNNDTLLAYVMLRNATAGEVFNTPAGWTKLGATLTRSDMRLAVFYRRWVTGDPDNWTFTTTASGYLGAVVSLYRGAGTANPVPFATTSRDGSCTAGTQNTGEMLSDSYGSNWNSPCFLNLSSEGIRAKGISVTATGGKLITFLADATGSGPAWSSRDTSGLVWRRANQNSVSGATDGLSYGYLDRNVVVTGTTQDQASTQTAPSPQGNPIGIQFVLCPSAADCGGGLPGTDISVAMPTAPGDQPASYVQGQTVTWKAVVSNAGSATTGVGVGFTLPAGVSSLAWTCGSVTGGSTCAAASGTSVSTTVNLGATGSVTYMITGTVAATTFGNLAPTIAISAGSLPDLTPLNNTATVTTPMKLWSFAVTSAGACAGNTMQYTIVARDNGGATISNFLGQVSLSMGGYARGDWAQPTVTGVLDNGAGDDGLGTYAYAAGDSGSKVLRLDSSTAGTAAQLTVTLGAANNSASAVDFANTSGFTISPVTTNGGSTSVLVANRPHEVTIQTCSNYVGAKNLKLWINPHADTLPEPADSLKIRNATDSADVLSTVPRAAPGANNVSLTFTAGSATVKILEGNIRKFSLQVRDDNSGSALVGTSTSLASRPFGFSVIDVVGKNDSGVDTGNPGATTAAGGAFVRTGNQVNVRFQPVGWEASDDADGDGHPDAGANLSGNPVVLGYTAPISLSTATFEPATGNVGSVLNFAGGTAAAVPARPDRNAAASGADHAWAAAAEIIAYVKYTEIGAARIDLSSVDALTGQSVIDNRNTWVGRFLPKSLSASFTTAPTFKNSNVPGWSCNFSYLGAEFGFATAPQLTIRGNKADGSPSANYRAGWAKINAAGLGTIEYASNASAGSSISGTPSTSDLARVDMSDGRIVFTLATSTNTKFVRSGSPQNPFDAEIELKVGTISDGEAAVSGAPAASVGGTSAGTGIAFAGSKNMRFGWISGAQSMSGGAPTADAAVKFYLKYWNAGAAQPHTGDTCTTLSAANIGVSFNPGPFAGGTVDACETYVKSISGFTGASMELTATVQGPGATNAGKFTISTAYSGAASYCSGLGGPAAYVGTTPSASHLISPGATDGYSATEVDYTAPATTTARRRVYVRENF